MDALGMIETKGLIAAIEACDVMLKTANVKLVGKRKSTATLVTILVTGDVGAVQASVEAGAAAAEHIRAGSVLSAHVIPRPINNIAKVFGSGDPQGKESKKQVTLQEVDEEALLQDGSFKVGQELLRDKEALYEEEPVGSMQVTTEEVLHEELSENAVDNTLEEISSREVLQSLQKKPVVELRKLARQYGDFEIQGREISVASKKTLLEHFESYYRNKM